MEKVGTGRVEMESVEMERVEMERAVMESDEMGKVGKERVVVKGPYYYLAIVLEKKKLEI